MWNDKGRSGHGDTNLAGTYDDVILGVSPNGRQYRNEATLEQRDLSGWAYWNLRKQNTPEQEIPEALYARNETESMSHTLANGRANLAKYADTVVVRKPVSKVSIEDKILPQKKRLNTLRSQMIELEQSYRNEEMSVEKYSLLRDIIVAKIQRQEVLYKRAGAVKPRSEETDGDGLEYTPCRGFSAQDDDGYGVEESELERGSFIDELSDTNSFKKILQKGCKSVRTLVRWHQASKRYIQTLKEV